MVPAMATIMDIDIRHQPSSQTADLGEALDEAKSAALRLASQYPDAQIKINVTRPARRDKASDDHRLVIWGIHLKAHREGRPDT